MGTTTAHPPNGPTGAQTVFARAFADWSQLYERYRSLRSISDAMVFTSLRHPDHAADMLSVEAEIDDLECLLEDATMRIALAPDAMAPDIFSILGVVLADLKTRHLVSDTDLTIRLITTAQRLIAMATSERTLP